MAACIPIRMAHGRDCGRMLEVEREAALELVRIGKAVHAAYSEPEFIPNFRVPAADLDPQRQLREVADATSKTQAAPEPAIVSGLAETVRRVTGRKR